MLRTAFFQVQVLTPAGTQARPRKASAGRYDSLRGHTFCLKVHEFLEGQQEKPGADIHRQRRTNRLPQGSISILILRIVKNISSSKIGLDGFSQGDGMPAFAPTGGT
jgi:hypothetical protein